MRLYSLATIASLVAFPAYAGDTIGEPMPDISKIAMLSLQTKSKDITRGYRCAWTQQMYVGANGSLEFLVYHPSHNPQESPFLVLNLKDAIAYVDNKDKKNPGTDWVIDRVLRDVKINVLDYHPFCAPANHKSKPIHLEGPMSRPKRFKKQPSFENSG